MKSLYLCTLLFSLNTVIFSLVEPVTPESSESEGLKEIRSYFPAVLLLRETDSNDFNFREIYRAFFCANCSLNHEQRHIVCGGIFGHDFPGTDAIKWEHEVKYHVHKIVEFKEHDPFKQAEIIQQAVDGFRAYREKHKHTIEISENTQDLNGAFETLEISQVSDAQITQEQESEIEQSVENTENITTNTQNSEKNHIAENLEKDPAHDPYEWQD